MDPVQISGRPTSGVSAPAGDGEPPGTTARVRFGQDLCWQSVQRILGSEHFAKSQRLSAFLAYVAERSLRGRESEVTEQQIGIHVFRRPSDYNPGDDNIVRQTARQLRQRLALFYQEEGRDETIRILMPRGGYLLHFEPGLMATSKDESVPARQLEASVTANANDCETINPAPTRHAASPSVTRAPIFSKPIWLVSMILSIGILMGVQKY